MSGPQCERSGPMAKRSRPLDDYFTNEVEGMEIVDGIEGG